MLHCCRAAHSSSASISSREILACSPVMRGMGKRTSDVYARVEMRMRFQSAWDEKTDTVGLEFGGGGGCCLDGGLGDGYGRVVGRESRSCVMKLRAQTMRLMVGASAWWDKCMCRPIVIKRALAMMSSIWVNSSTA